MKGSKERRSYAEITHQDRNPIKRFLQRRRLRDALSVLDGLDAGFSGGVLDFGGGDGEISRAVARRFPRAQVVCYEPAPRMLEEAKENLAGLPNVAFAGAPGEIPAGPFGFVFCLEVFEHLPPRQTARVVKMVRRLLADDGRFVVGVPNEVFAAALVKGIFRMSRRYGAFDARPANVLRAALGRPPKGRPRKKMASGLPYHFHHTGFDHRELEAALSRDFEMVRRFGSPAGWVPISSEVYLVMGKLPGTASRA